MINNDLFSVVTVSYNSAKTITKTIKSILNQSIKNFEYIIIDGKSTDNTVGIIKSFEDEFRQKGIKYTWVSEHDSGIYNAFNKGIKISSGNWISFLGSDDYYFDNALELYGKQIQNLNTHIDLIYSNVNVANRKIIKAQWSWKVFRKKMNIAHVGAFHNKGYFKKYGLYNETYKIAGDYELLLRAKQNLKTHWFNSETAFMSDDGISNNQIIKVYRETSKAKIETKSQSNLKTKLDYYTWVIKYRIKTLLDAFTR
ncbi:MAG: glycosyltransferase family 2 protein [Polaribacter sp.]